MTLNDLETRTGQATTEHGGSVTLTEALRRPRPTTRPHRPRPRLQLSRLRHPARLDPSPHHHPLGPRRRNQPPQPHLGLPAHREFERQGWTCHLNNGVPWWTPPTWIDPTRTPRRNHTRHLERLLPHPPRVPPTRKNSTGPRSQNLTTTPPTRQSRDPQLTALQT